MTRKSKGKFKMKGHTLPGINQKSETANLKDGRSPSSAFQHSAIKQLKQEKKETVKEDPRLRRETSWWKGEEGLIPDELQPNVKRSKVKQYPPDWHKTQAASGATYYSPEEAWEIMDRIKNAPSGPTPVSR